MTDELPTVMDISNLKRLQVEQHRAVSETDEKIAQWEKFKSDYEALQQRLKTLPDEVHHDVMVPFGSVGLMPGKLIHTNEVMVLLGDNWFAERSAKQASEIVSRRIKSIEKTLSELHGQRKLLTPRQVFTQELQDMAQGSSEVKEIVEPYDSDTEKKWKEAHRKNVRSHREKLRKGKHTEEIKSKEPMDDDALWSRLDELEKQETERDELERLHVGKEIQGRQPSGQEREEYQWKKVAWADETDENESKSSEGTSASDYDTDTEDEIERKQKSRITFSHSKPSKTSDESSASSSETADVPVIVSPSDIYKQFVQPSVPKSILKAKTLKQKAVAEKRVAEQKRDKASEVKPVHSSKKAFTGTVLEKSSPGESSKVTTAAKPKMRPVSKFRAMRQSQGSNN